MEIAVRDYECDIQGVVNNAVYQNYLEHARHEYIKTLDIDFAGLHADGIDPMVTRAEIDYKRPLRSGDIAVITVVMEQQGRMRLVFNQEIFDKTTKTPVMKAVITAAVVKNGRPVPVSVLYGGSVSKPGTPV